MLVDALRGPGAAVAVGGVGGERERQRRAVGPRDQLLGERAVGEAVGLDEGQRRVGGHRVELELDAQPLPAVLEPAGLGRGAAGEDDDRVRGEAAGGGGRGASRTAAVMRS